MFPPDFQFKRLQARLDLINQHIIQARSPIPPFELTYHDSQETQTIPYNSYWGEWVRDFWMRSRYQIPADWPLEAVIGLHLPIGDADNFLHPEALIYIDDVPFTAVDARHLLLILPEQFKDHAEHRLDLDGWTGTGGTLHGDTRQKSYMLPCSVVRIHAPTQDLVVLARNALQAAYHLPKDNAVRVRLISLLWDVLNAVDTRHPIGETFYASVPGALAALQEGIAELGAPQAFTVHAAGHAHIDTAWMWTLSQSRRKVERTFHTVLHLMDQYPQYHFTQSQPQLYEYLREKHPALFARVQEANAQGRWEAIGGMWVESDCNITGAESLVRQFLYGRRYYREHLTQESPVLWLPDTFGFPATLPQIAVQAGMRYFFTTKLRWSEYNQIPYDTFWWEGLDGTQILSHFTPTPAQSWWHIATYNAEANALAMIESWVELRQKDLHQRALMAYGWGDGGGGPTPEMLQNLSVLHAFPGIPKAEPGKALTFFEKLEDESADLLSTWRGELYLETHQGTLTSQAWMKWANRQTEKLLHDVEFLSAYARQVLPDFAYPDLLAMWRDLLTHQFHDILPGSSIKEVYDDARTTLTPIMARLRELRSLALRALAGDEISAANTTSFARPLLVVAESGTALPDTVISQPTSEGTLVYHPQPVPGYSVVALASLPQAEALSPMTATPELLEHDRLRVEFDAAGNLTRVFDKVRGRDVLEGIGNDLQFFEDRPLLYDAWNIDPDFETRRFYVEPAEQMDVVESGPIRATLKVVRRFMHSTITQYISITQGSSRVDFRTEVDWQERYMLLKVAFPVAVHVPEATYHIQWGMVKRPTHRSTSWAVAQHEVAAHHWADLSEPLFGVSLLNDCKYAYDVRENVLRLSLLKSATFPDALADLGQQHFTYSLLPHGAGLAETLLHGYDLNYPMQLAQGTGAAQTAAPFVISQSPDVVVETIKKAEDTGQTVVRLVEHGGKQQEAVLAFGVPIIAVTRANLMEEAGEPVVVEPGSQVRLHLRPFEIVTLLVE
ncbi:MAG: alpha-mannosidase [Anaerolineae bacterium]